jgi:hypothetical protein
MSSDAAMSARLAIPCLLTLARSSTTAMAPADGAAADVSATLDLAAAPAPAPAATSPSLPAGPLGG